MGRTNLLLLLGGLLLAAESSAAGDAVAIGTKPEHTTSASASPSPSPCDSAMLADQVSYVLLSAHDTYRGVLRAGGGLGALALRCGPPLPLPRGGRAGPPRQRPRHPRHRRALHKLRWSPPRRPPRRQNLYWIVCYISLSHPQVCAFVVLASACSAAARSRGVAYFFRFGLL